MSRNEPTRLDGTPVADGDRRWVSDGLRGWDPRRPDGGAAAAAGPAPFSTVVRKQPGSVAASGRWISGSTGAHVRTRLGAWLRRTEPGVEAQRRLEAGLVVRAGVPRGAGQRELRGLVEQVLGHDAVLP
jgi:hypothetical protein